MKLYPKHYFPFITILIVSFNFLFYFGQFPMWDFQAFSCFNSIEGFLNLFRHIFVHISAYHLFSNMMFFMFFGPMCEKRLGHFLFLVFYLFCGIIAALGFGLITPYSYLVGASGATSGCLAIWPFIQKNWVSVFLGVVLTGFYFITDFLLAIEDIIKPLEQSPAYMAHIFGAFAGLFFLCLYYKGKELIGETKGSVGLAHHN